MKRKITFKFEMSREVNLLDDAPTFSESEMKQIRELVTRTKTELETIAPTWCFFETNDSSEFI